MWARRTSGASGGGGVAALLAVFALLIQAFVPAAAMAASTGDGSLVICTQTGTATIAVDGHAPKPKGFAGMPCQDCLAAALAVTQTPELEILPVVYAAVEIEHAPVRRLIAPRARAPPRPPGQGPPTA